MQDASVHQLEQQLFGLGVHHLFLQEQIKHTIRKKLAIH
jgi:hypothetical protein